MVADVPLALNVAVTAVSALIITVHVPVPEQPPPDQPANVEPVAGVAVSVTCVPVLKPAVHLTSGIPWREEGWPAAQISATSRSSHVDHGKTTLRCFLRTSASPLAHPCGLQKPNWAGPVGPDVPRTTVKRTHRRTTVIAHLGPGERASRASAVTSPHASASASATELAS